MEELSDSVGARNTPPAGGFNSGMMQAKIHHSSYLLV
jgi:hypothetical protein